MAYKFQRGAATASGSFTAENGLTSNNALSVTAGTSTLQAVSAQGVTATTLSSSGGLQVGTSATIASGLNITGLGATITGSVAVSGSITSTGNISVTAGILSASNAVQTAGVIRGQTVSASLGAELNAAVVTTITGSGAATFASLTVDSVDINGGAIDGTTIGATAQSSVKATTLSASSNLQVGTSITASSGILVNAGGLTVSAGDSSLQKLTVNGDLIVLGTTFSASVGSLLIEDAAIVIGDGSTAFGTGYGINFGSGSNQWATLLTAQDNIDGVAGNENILSSSLAIKAPAFAGTLYGTMASPVTLVADAGTLATGINYFADVVGASSVTLPGAPSVGDSVRVKAPSNCSTTNTITINRSGSHTIDAENFIVLESPFAAVECVYVATNLWRIF